MPRQRLPRRHAQESGLVAAGPVPSLAAAPVAQQLVLLYRYCLLTLTDASAAQDATARAFSSLRSVARPRGVAEIGRLWRAAEAECADAARRAPPRHDADTSTLRAELAALPDDMRRAMELQLCGWPTAAVAAALGLTPRAVRALRANGLRRLAGLPQPRRTGRAALEIERRWAALRAGQPARPTPLDAAIVRLEELLAPPLPTPTVLAALRAQLATPPVSATRHAPRAGSRAGEQAHPVRTLLAGLAAAPYPLSHMTGRLAGSTLDLPAAPPLPSHARRVGREALQLVASALIFGLLGALLALTLRGGPTPVVEPATAPPAGLSQWDRLPRAGVVTQTLRVGADARVGPLAAGSGLWVPLGPPDGAANALAQLEPQSGRVISTVRVTPRPAGLALAFGSLWVSGVDALLAPGGTSGELVRLDPDDGRVLARIPLPGYASSDPDAIVADADAVWVADRTRPYVWRVDPVTNTVTASIRTRRGSTAIAVGGGSVWIGESLSFRGRIARIDPARNQVVATFDAGRVDGPLVYAAGSLWCFTSVAGVSTLVRLDPGSGATLARIALPGDGQGLVERDGQLWVATSALDPLAHTPEPGWSNTLLEVDPATNALVAALPLAVSPTTLVVDGPTLWVYAPSAGELLRIQPA